MYTYQIIIPQSVDRRIVKKKFEEWEERDISFGGFEDIEENLVSIDVICLYPLHPAHLFSMGMELGIFLTHTIFKEEFNQ